MRKAVAKGNPRPSTPRSGIPPPIAAQEREAETRASAAPALSNPRLVASMRMCAARAAVPEHGALFLLASMFALSD